MLRCWLTLLLALLATGCNFALPSSAQYPLPLPSAAQPAASGKGDSTYARRGADAIRTALRELEPEDALEQIPREGLQLPEAEVSAACAAAPGTVPVLICHYGPVLSQPVAQVILWHGRGGWQSQLYPQASQKLATERRKALAEHGCQIGCYSAISLARQTQGEPDPELLVVVNLGFTGAFKAEEVQTLRFKDGQWSVVWVPAAGDWGYGHAEVVLPTKGLNNFQVKNSSWIRQDSLAGYLAEPQAGEHRHFQERWVRKGEGYMLRDRAEEPSPFGSLVRLIHYLSTSADEKALGLLTRAVPLQEARKTLAQNPRRQGWAVTKWGDHGFLLKTTDSGKPSLGVRFVKQGDDWLLAEVWETNP